MADQFSSAPGIYPQGSYYEDLDKRIRALETAVGAGAGAVPDYSITEYKLGDQAVTTRSLKDANVTTAKRNYSDKPVLYVRPSASQTVTSSVMTKATFGTPVAASFIDTVGGWSTANNQYVVQKAGTYRVTLQAFFSSGAVASAGVYAAVFKNSVQTEIFGTVAVSAVPTTTRVTTILNLAVNDIIDGRIQKNGAGNGITDQTQCFLSLEMV